MHAPLHADVVNPWVLPYEPAGQAEHGSPPVLLNRPAGHMLLLGTEVFELHMFAASAAASQDKHTAAPAGLYVPASHATAVADDDPGGHLYPALHGLGADTLLPAGQ